MTSISITNGVNLVYNKKIFESAVVSLLTLFISFCCNATEAAGDISKVRIDYGVSEIYTQEDMDSAIEIIKEKFSRWDGCELHSIRYTDDDYCNIEKNIKWMNDLAEGQGYEPNFTQCIAFFSSFHSPKSDEDNKTTFNTDSEYEDWSWYLARTDGGEWKLMTFGYN